MMNMYGALEVALYWLGLDRLVKVGNDKGFALSREYRACLGVRRNPPVFDD